MTNEEFIGGYLERIGLGRDYSWGLDARTLRDIQYAHVMSVPYENLDILAERPLALDEDGLYTKIVKNRRGGYCFEVNGLLACLLRRMGFKTEEFFARFLRGETQIPMHRHRVVRAYTSDGAAWLCDVGIGQTAPRYPVKIAENEVSSQFGEKYRFITDERLGYIMQEEKNGEWRNYISFFPEPQVEADFYATSFFCEKHPSSPFNKTVILAVKTADGRITVDGDTLRILTSGGVTERTLEQSERPEIYKKYFGITL